MTSTLSKYGPNKDPKALCAGCGRYIARSSSEANVKKKQCVKPLFKFSGLLFKPHSIDLISLIFDGNARKASSTFFTSSALLPSLNLNKTTWRNIFPVFDF